MARKINLSICLYKNGQFDVFIEDHDGNSICLSGEHKLTDEQKEFADAVAPACVMTVYERVTPEDK